MGDPGSEHYSFLPIPAHKVRMPTDEQDHNPFNSLWVELDEFVRILQLNVTQLRELKSQKEEARSVLKKMDFMPRMRSFRWMSLRGYCHPIQLRNELLVSSVMQCGFTEMNAYWSGGFIFLSAVMGAVIGGSATIRRKSEVPTTKRRDRDKAEADLIHGFVQAIADEIQSVWDRYNAEIGPHLKS